jgi:hypothetical protein
MKLCQRERGSCGACCGLYNRADPSRAAVNAELRRRTRALAGLPRTVEAFRAAAASLEAAGPAPLFPSVRVCPLLGYLDAGETRIGCLAHPAVTGGPDLRDCGVYDASICESFLCPSFSWLTEEEAVIAEETTGGEPWLYGLVVTDVPFLRAVLAAVADGAGARVGRRHLADGTFRAALRRLLELKSQLAPGSEGLFGAFAAGPGGEDRPRHIDYAAIGRDRSRYDAILLCAGADPRSGNDLDALEDEVRRRLDAAVKVFPVGAEEAGRGRSPLPRASGGEG